MTGRTALRGVTAVTAGPRAVAELFVLAEDLVLQPAPRLGPGHRVEQDPEHDSGQEQGAVASLVLFLPLDPVGRRAEILDRRAELVLDVLVAGNLARDCGHAAAADQLVVDVARGRERAAEVVAQLFVLDRPLHIGRDVCNTVFRLGHRRSRPFARLQATILYPRRARR